MVGPLVLWKLLHCKTMRSRTSRSKSSKVDIQGPSYCTPSEVSIKREKCDEQVYEQNTCRVCLKEGNIPIYGNNEYEDVSKALTNYGGIDIKLEDSYPKYLCYACNALLQGAILLRKTAQQSDQTLKHPIQYEISVEDDIGDTDLSYMDVDVKKEKAVIEKEKPKLYHCKRCSLFFETLEEYSSHRLSNEHENMRITCSICNNTYVPMYFKKHMALHKLETSYMCDICGKKFVIQGHFTRHRVTHFYDLPFKCGLCPYRGRFSESLKMHMRSHTGEKPYQCTQCPSRFFVNKSNLNKHMLTHKTHHDYKCDQCPRGFYTKRDLETHFKVDHNGIKDHICDICGKAFGTRKQMMKHQLKVHKREKRKSGRTPLYVLAESIKQNDKS